jgi:hypothetical protein
LCTERCTYCRAIVATDYHADCNTNNGTVWCAIGCTNICAKRASNDVANAKSVRSTNVHAFCEADCCTDYWSVSSAESGTHIDAIVTAIVCTILGGITTTHAVADLRPICEADRAALCTANLRANLLA